MSDFVFQAESLSCSNEYGWGTENIRSYEVVLANSTITTASSTQNADLSKVFRRGVANFGIVTSLTLEAVSYKGGQVGKDEDSNG